MFRSTWKPSFSQVLNLAPWRWFPYRPKHVGAFSFYLFYNVLIILLFLTLCASVGNKKCSKRKVLPGYRSSVIQLTVLSFSETCSLWIETDPASERLCSVPKSRRRKHRPWNSNLPLHTDTRLYSRQNKLDRSSTDRHLSSLCCDENMTSYFVCGHNILTEGVFCHPAVY